MSKYFPQLRMKLLSVLSVSSFLAFANAAAPISDDSPKGASYVANFDGTVSGSVGFKTVSNGSVEVSVDLAGLPSQGGPFLYHVHEYRVPANGSCLATGGHLNPYNGSATATQPNELEVGDLAGRHGDLNGPDAKLSYVDNYISLNSEDPAFIGNRSVVIHYHNTTRLACANIEKSSNSSGASTVVSDSGDSIIKPTGLLLVAGAALGLLM